MSLLDRLIEKHGSYTLKEIKAMEVILKASGGDNLVIEEYEDDYLCRIWISRNTVYDGEPYNNKITIEYRLSDDTEWKEYHYKPKDDKMDIYVGMMLDVQRNEIRPCSMVASNLNNAKELAGQLAINYVNDNDPDHRFYLYKGVFKLNKDYVVIEETNSK